VKHYFAATAMILTAACTSGAEPDAQSTDDFELAAPDGAALNFSDGDTVYVQARSLRIRHSPAPSGAVVGSVGKGASLQVLRRSGEWLEITRNDSKAWVAARYVSPGGQSASPVAASRPARSSSNNAGGGGFSWFGKSCKKGKPCGNACISVSRTCHK
jgi:uncharacterized protein YgiM (DUF1202 family)